MFIPHDRMFQHIDKICLEFAAIAKGLEHNKENIHKAHNVTHINSLVKYGGLGLQQIYWASRPRYVTLVQGLPRKPTGRLSRLVAQPIERVMTPLRDYVTVLSQIGGNTTLVVAPRRRPPTSANLIDEQTSGDEEWITQQEVAVGIPELARRYVTRCSANEDPTDGEVPPSFTPVEMAGIQCYTNGKQAEGAGKLTREVGGRTIYRAGGAITCGPLLVITRVTGPQTSYRAELQSVAVNSTLASAHQELTYDNKAVVDHALQPPHRERSDVDLRLTIQEETEQAPPVEVGSKPQGYSQGQNQGRANGDQA